MSAAGHATPCYATLWPEEVEGEWHLEWQGKAINQVEFTGKPSENCQSPGSDDEDGDIEQTGTRTGTGTETATGTEPQRAALSTSNVGF